MRFPALFAWSESYAPCQTGPRIGRLGQKLGLDLAWIGSELAWFWLQIGIDWDGFGYPKKHYVVEKKQHNWVCLAKIHFFCHGKVPIKGLRLEVDWNVSMVCAVAASGW